MDAHVQWNQERARALMTQAVNLVIIDNTNTMAWEMQAYVNLVSRVRAVGTMSKRDSLICSSARLQALVHGYHVEMMEPPTPWRWDACELAQRNSHSVDQQQVCTHKLTRSS